MGEIILFVFVVQFFTFKGGFFPFLHESVHIQLKGLEISEKSVHLGGIGVGSAQLFVAGSHLLFLFLNLLFDKGDLTFCLTYETFPALLFLPAELSA